jgi:hypothetical protein
MEYSTKTRLSLHSTVLFTLRHYSTKLHIGIILHSYIVYQRGRKYKGLTKVSIFGDSCQRGRNIKPKAKGPHPPNFLNCVLKIFIGIFQIGMCQFQMVSIKTLLKTKRRIPIKGEFCLKSKEKHLE